MASLRYESCGLQAQAHEPKGAPTGIPMGSEVLLFPSVHLGEASTGASEPFPLLLDEQFRPEGGSNGDRQQAQGSPV